MNFRPHLFRLLTIAILVAGSAHPCCAQPVLIKPMVSGSSPVEPGTPPNSSPSANVSLIPPGPTLDAKRAENSDQLRIAMRKLEANGTTDTASAQDVTYYQTREAVLTQQDTVERQVKDLESRKTTLQAFIDKPRVDTKQYTFADLEQMKDDLAAEQARSSFVSDKLSTAKANVKSAQAAVDECETKLRDAQSAYDDAKDAPNAGELAAAVDQARKDSTLASETLALRKQEFDRELLSQQVEGLVVQLRKDKVARVSPQVKFTEADLKEQLDSIKKSEASATTASAQAQTNLNKAEIDYDKARTQLAAATDATRPALMESLMAQRAITDRFTEEQESLTQRLSKYSQLECAWRRRYLVATTDRANTDDETYTKLKDAQKSTAKVLDSLAQDLRMQIGKMKDVRSSLTSVVKKAEAASKGPSDIAAQLAIQQTQLESQLKIYEKNLVINEMSRRVHEKLLDELNDAIEVLSPKALALGAWYQVKQVWTYPLSIGDQAIKVGDAIKGLTILIVGWMLSRSTSGVFANRFLKRFRLSKDATSAIRSLVFYSLLMFFALSALDTVGVPLTAFTILGGGLAIGVGFGSQTLINNFIGGLIMLAERPVRLGERITYKDMDGVVEDVGFRCTKLRTPSDHLVTIPNSTLVNESIENIDRRRTIRRAFTVAVTYNITHELLSEGIQAIRDILDEKDIRERIHPIVGFEELSPRVHFTEFATESLNIQITYWYAPVDSLAFTEHSERVNLRIMEEFGRLGIEFAFPSKTTYVPKQNRGPGRSRGDSYAA